MYPSRSKLCEQLELIENFGRLIVIGQSCEISIQELIKYELASYPLTLFCLGGSLRKTVNSVALEWLETAQLFVTYREFPGKTLYVIDFIMLLQMSFRGITDCRTFGDLSDKLFRKVFQPQYQYVTVVGDNYKVKLSIKGVECTGRGSTQIHEIRNLSRNTTVPKQRHKMLFDQKNKIKISDFIMSDWIRKGEAELVQDRYLYLSDGFNDKERAICVTNGKTQKLLHFSLTMRKLIRACLYTFIMLWKHLAKKEWCCGVLTPMFNYVSKVQHC